MDRPEREHEDGTARPLGPVQALARVVESFDTLVREHLALARAELEVAFATIARGLRWAVMALPLLLAGYGLLCVALMLAVEPLLGAPVAALAVGLANLVAGSFLLRVAMHRLSARQLALRASSEELEKTIELARGMPKLQPQKERPSEPSTAEPLEQVPEGRPGGRGTDGERPEASGEAHPAGSGGDQGRDRAGAAGAGRLGAGAA